MDDHARIETVKQYLRRTYASNVDGLKLLAENLVRNGGATDAVTITGQSFEGGQAQGQLTFEPLAYLGAIESLILELDPTYTPSAPSRTLHLNFGFRPVSL